MEQTITYDLYAKKIYNGVEYYSTFIQGSSSLPNDPGNYYIVNLTHAAVTGASYKIHKYDGNALDTYYSYSGNQLVDYPSLNGDSSTVTPNIAILATLYAENTITSVTQEGVSNFINKNDQSLSFNSFSYKNGDYIINIGKYGVQNGEFFIGSQSEAIRLGDLSNVAHTSFSNTSSTFNVPDTNAENYKLYINGTLDTKGLITRYVKLTTSTHYILSDDDYTVKNESGGSLVSLPSAVGRLGRVFCVINTHILPLTVNTTGSTINGVGSITINQNASRQFQSDGSNWNIIGGFL